MTSERSVDAIGRQDKAAATKRQLIAAATAELLVLGDPVPEALPDTDRLVAAMTGVWYRSVYGRVPDDVASPSPEGVAAPAPEQVASRVDDDSQTAPSA